MNQVSATLKSINGVKPKIVKGQQNRCSSSNVDANRMAQLEAERVREEELLKKQKIESFMNNTRINASRLYKEQCNKNLQQINCKKEIIVKQKQLKAKYTIVPKRAQKNEQMQQVRKLPREPIEINWKQAEDACKKIHVPVENCQEVDSSDNESGYDSEIDKDKNQTPEQVNNLRQKVRKMMMDKLKRQ